MTFSEFSACEKLGDKWTPIKKLGEGSFGAVTLVRSKRNSKLAAAKTVRPKEWTLEEGQIPEIRIFRKFIKNRSSRIIEFLGGVQHPAPSKGWSALLFEFCNGGDLHHMMYKYIDEGMKVPSAFVVHSLIHLIEALGFLHYGLGQSSRIRESWETIVHADIKALNIFLRWNPGVSRSQYYPDLVLGDFGLAQSMQDKSFSARIRGTMSMLPPEMIVTPLGDIWSAGATLHCMVFNGDPPVLRRPTHFRGSLDSWLERPEAHVPRDPAQVLSSETVSSWIRGMLEIKMKHRSTSTELWAMLPDMRQWRDRHFRPLESWAAPKAKY